ncbi:unnamed protein product [Pieris macdunnoughi]|uniref:Major facilitator superfamily (MFS) profile domain-containing protein n=1 Tax=Pieris macdunnoughi TaxID=345717 RepID=A0A821WRS9_9NEOP|nr:unnamed protein product [Pieris macdunnoughi]
MIFTSCWVIYMLRVNISLNLIAMVPEPAQTSASKRSQCASLRAANETFNANMTMEDAKNLRTQSKETFNWTMDQQGTIIGSYFWCYPFTSLVGGMAAERWGPRYVVLVTVLVSGVLTALSPAAARMSYTALVVIRFFLGSAGGFTYPALHALVAQWAPPRGKGEVCECDDGWDLGNCRNMVSHWAINGKIWLGICLLRPCRSEFHMVRFLVVPSRRHPKGTPQNIQR